MKRNKIIYLLLLLGGCCTCSNRQADPAPENKTTTLPASGYLALLDNPSERSLEISILVSSEFWLKEIKAHGFNKPLVISSNSKRGQELMATAREKGFNALPLVFFLDSRGGVLGVASAPNSINETKRLLNGGIR